MPPDHPTAEEIEKSFKEFDLEEQVMYLFFIESSNGSHLGMFMDAVRINDAHPAIVEMNRVRELIDDPNCDEPIVESVRSILHKVSMEEALLGADLAPDFYIETMEEGGETKLTLRCLRDLNTLIPKADREGQKYILALLMKHGCSMEYIELNVLISPEIKEVGIESNKLMDETGSPEAYMAEIAKRFNESSLVEQVVEIINVITENTPTTETYLEAIGVDDAHPAMKEAMRVMPMLDNPDCDDPMVVELNKHF